MARTGYQLEALEARVLLSGDSMVCAAGFAPEAERQEFPVKDAVLADLAAVSPELEPARNASALLVDPDANFDEVSFTLEQLTRESVDPDGAIQVTAAPADEPNNDSSPTRNSTAQDSAAEVSVVEVRHGIAEGDFVLTSVSALAVTGPTIYSPQVKQLTETLRSANGPPASSRESTPVTTSSAPASFECDVSAYSASPGQKTHLTPDQSLIAGGGLVVGTSDTVSGNGTIIGSVVSSGLLSPGNSPGILNVNGDLVVNPSGTVLIEIGGLTAGPGAATDLSLEPAPGSPLNGYDRINVTGNVTLGGTLQIQLINDFHPALGDTFTIITAGGAIAGSFASFPGRYIGDGLFLKPVQTGNAYQLAVVNWAGMFGSSPVPSNLNGVIDFLLNTFDRNSPPTGADAEFTSSAGEIPNSITIGVTLGGGFDLELMGVTLQFSGLAYNGGWTGQVGVTATSATLFKGLLDIVIADDGTEPGDDADAFAVAGIIDLALGAGATPDTLNLDDLDAEKLGWPGFLDVTFTDLAMNFPDFRGNDNQNSLELTVELTGFDTGNDALNDLLAADNPLFGLSIQGFASADLAVKEIEDAVIAAGSGDPKAALEAALAAAIATDITGLGGSISGKLFQVGSLSATFLYNTVTHDPDGSGPLPARSAVYLAVEGSLSLGPAITGDDDDSGGGSGIGGFGFAFAISELGPLQLFASVDVPILLEPVTGLAISSMRLGVRFNTTIQDLQTDKDFDVTGATVAEDGPGSFLVTLAVNGAHDLEGPNPGGTRPGDEFRVRGASNGNYNGDFTVVSATENSITFRIASNPGLFVGSAEILRLTIKDPLDLRDSGLESGIAPPDSLATWRLQLNQAVTNQIVAGDTLWEVLFDEVVFGGGATLSFDPRIPDFLLSFDVDFLLDTDLRIMLSGGMSLLDGLVSYPTRMFADLSNLFSGHGRFLYLQIQPEIPVFEPLLVYRGAVAFEALTAPGGTEVIGFSISLSGGVDLNIPGFDASLNPITVTTLTLEGETVIEFRAAAPSPGLKGGLELSLSFLVTLSESNFVDGEIASAAGLFQVNVSVTEGPTPAASDDEVEIVIIGAARLITELDFLERVGLFVEVDGFLRINSGGQDASITLPDGFTVNLPKNSFALRLDGSVDFRVDFDTPKDGFQQDESVFLIDGVLVLEFSAEQGFNVAVFSETGGTVAPATLKLGPANAPFLQFGVFGFLAIRGDGIAANMVLSLDAGLPGALADVASINGQFVFMVNTTGDTITFNIPGDADERGGASGLSVTIPRAPPASIAAASLNVFELIAGRAWSLDASIPGAPYVFVLLGGTDPASNPDATFVLGGFSLSGKFGFLASFDPASANVFVEMQFNARMRLLPLNGQLLASGSLKINDQGVVGGLMLGGQLNLGPLTIVGAFTLEVNTTDDEQLVPRYEFDFVNEVFKQDAQGNPVVQNLAVGADTVALFAFAKFRLTSSFVLQGSVNFVDNPELLSLDLDMKLQFFSTELNVVGGARIVKTGGSEGLVLKLSASLNASAFGVTGIFSFTAGLELRINARPGDQNTPLDANDLGLLRQTFRIEVSNATLSLLSVVTLTGSGYVEITQGVFRMQANLSGNFLSVFSVSASAFFSSEGEFRIVLDGGVQLGPSGFNLHASAHLEVSRLDLNGIEPRGTGNKTLYIEGRLSGGAEIFWIPINFPTLGVSYNSGSGDITVSVGPVLVPGIGRYRVRTWFGSFYIYYPTLVQKTFTFTIGTLKETPPDLPPPPPVTLGYVDPSGVLTLNVGSQTHRAARNLLGVEENEEITIERLAGGSQSGETIRITLFGVSQEFHNVTSIRIELDSGNDLVEIAAGVTIPTEIHFGAGNDTLRNQSGAVVVAYGDEGEDRLEGGSANDRLFGGTGDDFIDGKAGNDWIEGGDHDDVLIGGAGGDSINGGEGDDLIAGDLAPFPPVLAPPDVAGAAQDINGAGWNLNLDADITDSGVLPHVSILGTGDGTFDYYSFTVTTAGTLGIFDIDAENFDTQLFLYDSSGNLLASNDDNGSDAGSGSTAASLINFVFPAAGTYVIGVGERGSFHAGEAGAPGQIGGDAPDVGDAYTLHISVQNHAVNATGNDPITELESNQPLLPVRPDSFVFQTAASDTGAGDTILGGNGNDVILGGGGNDDIRGEAGEDILVGDEGMVSISETTTVAGDVTTYETESVVVSLRDLEFGGNDIILGGPDDDIILGGSGNDTLGAEAGADTLLGDDGIVTISRTETVAGGESLSQAQSIVVIPHDSEFSGNDRLDGGDGNDTFYAQKGEDIVLGGLGDDTLLGPPLANVWTLNESNAGDLNGLLIFSSIETITGGSGADTLVGPAFANIWTLLGNNAGNLNSALMFSSIETITGGSGTDTLVGPAITNTWTLSGNHAGNLNGALLFASIETITGGSGTDTLFGPAMTNSWTLIGNNAGLLNGALTFSSIEHLIGGSGDDIFAFQPGVDFAGSVDGGGGVNGLDYSACTTGVTVDLETGSATGTAEIDNIRDVRGGSGDDTLLGNADDNVFEGMAGDDNLVGRGGADTISGGLGDDLIVGDQWTLTGANSLLGVNSVDEGDDVLTGGDGNDILLGDAAQVTWDASGLMTLVESANTGLGGADRILGGEGQDVIMGGLGDDAMDGGSGADLIFGDNARIARSALAATGGLNPRFRVLIGSQIYDPNGNPLVADGWQLDPRGVPAWGGFSICMLNNAAVMNSSVNDYLAGGAGDDMIFGQLGADTIQGDGSIDFAATGNLAAIGTRVGAMRDGSNALLLNPSAEATTDGDDYIEGGGGCDVIFGNLGQDDLIGGSSSLFGLNLAEQQADGSDLIFGGAGTDVARNHPGDQIAEGHARDADVIVGDNGNIFRLVGRDGQDLAAYLAFNYDNSGPLRIIPRAVALLDYVIGDPDGNRGLILNNVGAADEIHGESGDDVIYGMVGNDVLFGEAQDDDLVGGQGNDWISGGAGDDGVIGDDGRIFTSRNGLGEPLYGIQAVVPTFISTPGKVQQATINAAGKLTKSVDLVVMVVSADQLPAGTCDDIVYGGLGNDFIHGGDGDDALSGAEALQGFYDHPVNSGNALHFGGYGEIKGYEDATEFADYDQYHPLKRVNGFLLDFEASVADAAVDDGSDALFGDAGNDWLVGGTNRDFLFGGWGNDLLDADDNKGTADGLNNVPDVAPHDAGDLAYGGAGRDVLLANSASDRLIDWVGEFNSYVVPLSSFGMPTVSRTHQPQLAEFLYALSRSLGADQTRLAPEGGEAIRNGEPYGELGLVIQQDHDFWKAQVGPTNDPQSGNTPGSQRETRFLENFDSGLAATLAAVTENWKVSAGRYLATPARGAEAVSLLLLNDALPSYAELLATVNTNKGKSGVKSNAYLIFDYQDENNFKFAGIDAGLDKLRIGVRTSAGWTYLTQANMFLTAAVDYTLRLVLNGGSVTLQVTGPGMTRTLSHAFSAPVNTGWLGLATDNSVARFDNVAVQVLPPSVTQGVTDNFTDPSTNPFTSVTGDWASGDGRYAAAPGAIGDSAVSILSQDLLDSYGLELQVQINSSGFGGIVFDYENALNFKFAGLLAGTNQVVIGHRTAAGWFFDKVVKQTVTKGVDYQLGVSVHDATVRVMFNGVTVASQTYQGFLNDGRVGLFTLKGASQFDDVFMRATSR